MAGSLWEHVPELEEQWKSIILLILDRIDASVGGSTTCGSQRELMTDETSLGDRLLCFRDSPFVVLKRMTRSLLQELNFMPKDLSALKDTAQCIALGFLVASADQLRFSVRKLCGPTEQ